MIKPIKIKMWAVVLKKDPRIKADRPHVVRAFVHKSQALEMYNDSPQHYDKWRVDPILVMYPFPKKSKK